MNPENIALITQYLDKIGEKLGLTAGHLWPVFVRQQIVEFYVSIFCVFLCAVVFFPLVIYTVRNWNRSDSSSNSSIEDGGAWQAILVVSTAFVGVFLLASVAVSINSLSAFLNPEYGAMEDLMRMLKR